MQSGTGRVLRIACVDDNATIGEAFAVRAALEPTLEWAGVVFESTAKAIEAKLCKLKPDVALLDIDMPGIDAFALAESMAAAAPEIRAVMFSGHLNRKYIERALDCGAWGYLSKNDDVDSIIAGVRKVADGQIALSAEAELVLRRDRVG